MLDVILGAVVILYGPMYVYALIRDTGRRRCWW